MCSPRSRLFAAAILVGLSFAPPGRLFAQNWNDERAPWILRGQDPGLLPDPAYLGLISGWRHPEQPQPKVDPILLDELMEAIQRGEVPQKISLEPVAPPTGPARTSTGPLLVGIAVGTVLGALLTLIALRLTRKG